MLTIALASIALAWIALELIAGLAGVAGSKAGLAGWQYCWQAARSGKFGRLAGRAG